MATGEASGTSAREVIIRKCETLEEMRACFDLQKEVWNFSDAELVPVRLFVVANKIGGQVIGAFDGVTLAGFAIALPAIRNGHSYLHSQMLAVRQQFRNSGIGQRLKLAQRDDALARGFELMEWTFDPLEIKNAYLNVEKLGAIARRYNANQYGITTSPLQGGLPSDRLVAEWWMKSRRVEMVLSSGKKPSFATRAIIAIPAQINEWKASSETQSRALEIQKQNKMAFETAFTKVLAVLGYERDADGTGRFLLGQWDENYLY